MPYAPGCATMDDDPHVIDNGWDALPEYADKADGDDAVTVSISTIPGEWLVNTVDSVVVPMSMAELVDGLRAGTLTERSLVWRQGMQEWACVDAVPQLKLAARLPSKPAAAARALSPEKPSAPSQRPAPSRPAASPHAGLSRRSTLPFGLPTPPSSRPAHAKPTSSQPASLSPDEPEVLAVYARPAATISFDLSPEQPLRAPPPPSVPAPHSLAPTTADSAPRSAPPYRGADLSVVAAADFRAVKRSSKRLVLAWSLASAAAASLLTFWLSRSSPVDVRSTAAQAPAAGVTLAAPPAPVPPSAAPVILEPTPTAATSVNAAPAASAAPLAKAVATPKAKPARKRKIVAAPQAPSTEPSAAETSSGTKSPSSEPNPYDVKLEDDVPAAKPPAARSPGLDEAPAGDASPSSPGF
jgi:hypothetical protein